MTSNAPKKENQTPLMKQYLDIKNKYPDAFVFFRLGDFYEMFYDDAKKASSILGITLTKRQGIPMCGVPYHSSSNYVAKLLKEGKKVAICEQTQTPAEAKSKLVKRQVVRVVTPGTVTEDELLNSQDCNHLVCIALNGMSWGFACVEASTGDFWTCEKMSDEGLHQLSGLITRTNPSEIIADDNTARELKMRNIINGKTNLTVVAGNANYALPESWKKTRMVRENKKFAVKCALNACRYVETNEPQLKNLLVPDYREDEKYMELDENAVKTLELVESEYGEKKHTLWGVLNNCSTSMGMRFLRRRILHPLLGISEIRERQNCVEKLLKEDKRERLCQILKNISDLERIITRISASSASPRDIGGLKSSLAVLGPLKNWLENSAISKTAQSVNRIYGELDELCNLLCKAIAEELPAKIGEGKEVIKNGYNNELDELRSFKKDARAKLKFLQERERASTGITSLKVGYNSVFGYYIEITKSHLAKVPYNYVRKQTLVNCERFITQELKEMESKILGAEDRMIRLENFLFDQIRNRLGESAPSLKKFAKCIAELDVYFSLAVAAVKNGYVKPELNPGGGIAIEGGRHAIVERNMPAGEFVTNDLKLNGNLQMMIITGPNMSGKSVYLRQNALIVIMAQMGSFVPAKKAAISITDRIMTRIGARDILSKGDSTFMVEMKETAKILNLATSKTLVLLDEVGRGTSTFDGVSIAWAVAEFLYDASGGPKVLFATHYFELTELARKYSGIKNFNVKVEETVTCGGKSELVFLHKVGEGPSDKSYGIHVAELAGISPACILRARQILSELENRLAVGESEKKEKLPMQERHLVLEQIADCKPEKLTPLEALQIISQWKKMV
jgi:DNA mismatch repair protein MutS